MASRLEKIKLQRNKRKARVRMKISGTNERPRLSVFRSSTHLYAQVVDDVAGKTLASIASYSKSAKKRASKDYCQELGKKLAAICKEKKIETVVFDKGACNYHGRIKAFADGAREAGLSF